MCNFLPVFRAVFESNTHKNIEESAEGIVSYYEKCNCN